MSKVKRKCQVLGCERMQQAIGKRPAGKYKEYDKDGYLLRWRWNPEKTYYSTFCDKHRYVANRKNEDINPIPAKL